MAGLSPSRRLRTKTSEFSDFFRGASHNSRGQSFPGSSDTPRDSHSDIRSTNNATLEVPHSEPSTSKKFGSKLPFLGRTRKKSTIEETSASAARDGNRHETAQSPVVLAPMPVLVDAHPARRSKSRDAAYSSEHTFGSKFAAHFTPSKPRKSNASPSSGSDSTSRQTRKPGSSPASLRPPAQTPRSLASFESTSSGGSDNRSTTPRPAQPTFNVSISPPEDLRAYADLFTLPRKMASSSTQLGLSSPEPSLREGSQSTRSSASDALPVTPDQFASPAHPEVSDAPDSRPFIFEDLPIRPGSRSSVKSTGKQHHPEVENIDLQGQIRLSEDSLIDKERVVPPRLTGQSSGPPSPTDSRSRTPSSTSERPATSSRAMSRTRSGSGSRPSAPPTIPLPTPPPSSPPPTSALPSIPSNPSAPSRRSQSSISSISSIQSTSLSRRSRANTLSSVPSSPLVTSPYPPSPSLAAQPKFLQALKQDLTTDSERSDWERSDWDRSDIDDIDSATPEQLRQALVAQNLRLEELVEYCRQLTSRHQAEKLVLERQVQTLEREAARKDQEIKGLRWIVTDGRTASPTSAGLPIGVITRQSTVSEPDKPKRRAVPGTQSDGGRLTDDSEAEYPGMLAPSLRRNRSMAVSGPKMTAVRSTSTRVSPKGLGYELAVARAQGQTSEKRASMSSFSSTSTSSTSSLMPPSSTAASTVASSLSSIPETPPPVPSKPFPSRSSGKDEFNQRSVNNATPPTHRSPRTPSLTPAAAYAANLRKARPPSIAQVLNTSPSAEDIADKQH